MFIGAEIFIELGQTKSEIDDWFKTMKQHGLGLTRIRMFESYMHVGEVWDFSLFDTAFKAAEKYDIKIYANLFPETEFSDVGGFKFPKSSENLTAIAAYIKQVVEHFSAFSSLFGWVPINEPGAGSLPVDVFSGERYEDWKQKREQPSYNSNGFTTFELSEQRFLVDYNTWFLEWLTDEIRKYDPHRPIHVNNHDIFKNAAEYDFPAWRKFLTSLGGSAHASWHFDYFKRSQFGVAMSANAEMLRSGAGPLPWFMTELQGGNNTYSGKRPIVPTPEEIAQWLWINIGSGSEGGMFWCLNPRRSGFEAGEWAMLDFLNEPTERLLMASRVSAVINAKSELFDAPEVLDSGISILYTRESLWVEKALQIQGAELEGRMVGGVMKSALSYFEAFSEMGIHVSFNEIGEYDFSREDYLGKAIVLSHQISIPSRYWTLLERFVYKGGRLIVDGLSAYYDENAYCILGPDFPLKECFGATLREYRTIDNLFDMGCNDSDISLKSHLWQGILKLSTAEGICFSNKSPDTASQVHGCRNSFGLGSVLWIPTLLGLGSRIDGDYSNLSTLLRTELQEIIKPLPLIFKNHQPGMLMKILRKGDRYLSVIVNKSGNRQDLGLHINGLQLDKVIFSSSSESTLVGQQIQIDNEETLVVEWSANA